MNAKKTVYRLSLGSKESLPKNEMFRIVKVNNEIVIDFNQKINGRGAYIKKDIEAIKYAKKYHLLSKALRCDVKDEIYDALIKALS